MDIIRKVTETIYSMVDVDIDRVWVQTGWDQYSLYLNNTTVVIDLYHNPDLSRVILSVKEDEEAEDVIIEDIVVSEEELIQINNWLFSGLRTTDGETITDLEGNKITTVDTFVNV